MSGIELIVGLGNPEPKYLMTRHNAGFWFVDHVVDKLSVALRVETKFKGEVGEGVVNSRKIRFLKPLTYMNNSGQAVAALANFYKIPLASILVVYDDMDFDPGVIRLKHGGSAGRHNGVQSMIECLGGKDFWRLRLGVGHPGDRAKVTGFVLGKPSESDFTLMSEAVLDGASSLTELIEGDFQKVMGELHTKK
ncbi:MAG: aminoacyl-tRNA hydrolase [Methylococcales bacterium]|jgi:peptidyl-tRNA hydrolase, PTH1 family|nr:aminoacyl-tRNA hydrolase [Methylococcales bacterium]MBT7443830.1 aminoacyl-tRNA hydrolase [Methylococcales bacterium]